MTTPPVNSSSPLLNPRAVTLLAVLAASPFWLFQLEHFVRFGQQATGFVLFDMAYYPANGREIFERGNGLGYCNPYDPDPAAPVIYYHWLQWIFGAGIKGLGLDPGVWFLCVGLGGGLATAWLTFRLVEATLPGSRFVVPLYFLVMWGGGFLVAAAVLTNLLTGLPAGHDVLRLDPFMGWWALNWGRNLVLPTEAVYHACVATAWFGVVRGKPWTAVTAVGLLAATHPFSGIQHLLILGCWLLWRWLRDRQGIGPLLMLAAITAVFLGYYFLYLPSFPQHRAIHENWSLDWTLPAVSMVAAYLPMAAIAAVRLWQDRRTWRPEMTFFVIAAGTSFLLVHHNWFIDPKQPLHFTRGYVWLPLCLLGLPILQRELVKVSRGAGRAVLRTAIAAGLLLAGGDNIGWLLGVPRTPRGLHNQLTMPTGVRDAFNHLNETGQTGIVVVLFPGAFDCNYLSATYTDMIPFVGHPFLTPNYEGRVETAMLWERTGEETELFRSVDVMVVAREMLPPYRHYDLSRWEQLYANADTVVLQRSGQ